MRLRPADGPAQRQGRPCVKASETVQAVLRRLWLKPAPTETQCVSVVETEAHVAVSGHCSAVQAHRSVRYLRLRLSLRRVFALAS